MVRLLEPAPVPDSGYLNKVVPGTRVFSREPYRTHTSVGYGRASRTKLTKVLSTGMEAVSNLPKGRYGYGCCTKLTIVLGTGGEAVPSFPKCWGRPWKRGEAIDGSGSGMGVVPSLPKGRVRVKMSYQAYQK